MPRLFGKRLSGAPGAFFRLTDKRGPEAPGGTVASFLRALGKNGRVLWVQLLPADPDAEPEAGRAIVERRLVTTGRVSRETGEWIREEPFVPCAVRDGDGWTHVRVRLDPEKGLGNLPFNLGVARSYYKWVVLGADALSGADLETVESLWPLRVARV